jgi:hypothetical protein
MIMADTTGMSRRWFTGTVNTAFGREYPNAAAASFIVEKTHSFQKQWRKIKE